MSPAAAAAAPRRSSGPHLAGPRPRRGRPRANASSPAAATARTLAAGLWRLRPVVEREEPRPGHRRRALLRDGNKPGSDLGARNHCRSNGIVDKLEACVGLPYTAMEKATKWDHGKLSIAGEVIGFHDCRRSRDLHRCPATSLAMMLEAELENARARIGELEAEKHLTKKKFDQFLRKLTEEKALWKSRVHEKARNVVASMKEDLKMEKKHRRQLEAANSKLINELAEAKLSAKRYVQNYETERKARELMEEACDELTREVEEDQAEVEILRRECLSMREEMEEERRMLQMAEVWREERVQMKLTDAKLILEQKYSHLNKLQAEMESFLRKRWSSDGNVSALREAEILREAASSIRIQNIKEFNYANAHSPEEVNSVFEQFRLKEDANGRCSSASHVSNVHTVSPATDIFLERPDIAYANGSVDMEDDGSWSARRHVEELGHYTSSTGSDTSVTGIYKESNASAANGKGWDCSGENDQLCTSEITEVRPSTARPSRKRGSSISRLWRTSTSENSKKEELQPNKTLSKGWSPDAARSPELRSRVVAPTSPVVGKLSSSDSVNSRRTRESMGCNGFPQDAQKYSLKEKLLEARMDGRKHRLH